ncbi:MAG: hypothetical protein KF753_22965 [Caldilineaceae bacterium]|nr:hypothetical protein [Caldilineaceae bacterium]
MTFLDHSILENRHPEDHPHLQSSLVAPDILSALLNRRSTLVAAPVGYGKTTLAFLARKAANTWLHVPLQEEDLISEQVVDSLLAAITKQLWHYLGKKPQEFQRLGRRAEAVKYFFQGYIGFDIDYWLETLAEDRSEQKAHLHGLALLKPRQLFTETADDEMRLGVLLDCIHKLDFDGVGVWIDLDEEWEKLPDEVQDSLAFLYDFLNLLRNRNLHIKCLAVPSVIRFLEKRRGGQTLSVSVLTLEWTQAQLAEILNRRLALASQGKIQELKDLIDPERFTAFLHEYGDPRSPSAWLDLARFLAQQISETDILPGNDKSWLTARRAYCAEHLKIRRDEEGNFWRGHQLLEGLVPRKRAIYPLIKYLYEHPGIHRTYQLTEKLNMDENALNTNISRARKDHIEPRFEGEGDDEGGYIYLVTDYRRGGYGLQHTDRSP